jgi:O-succinylbenzoic acid--CoA ligase
MGIMNGDRVGIIILEDPIGYIETLLSCWVLDAIPVLYNAKETSSELHKMIEVSDPKHIVTNWESIENIKNIDTPIYPIEELSVGLGGCSSLDYIGPKDLNTVHLILFTSGSTGIPKVVQLTGRNLLESATAWHEQLYFRQDDVYLNCLPLHHISGISIFIRSLLYGFKTIQLNRFDPEETINTIMQDKVTLISMVPTILSRLLAHTNNEIPPSLRGIIISGGPSSEGLMNKCLTYDIPIYKSYGMTETSSGICGFWLQKYPSKFDSVGLPFNNVSIQVKNSEIRIKGKTVMSGYFHEAPLEEWLLTGDMGEMDNDGFIYIDKRRTDRIVTGGENVDPREIELILCKHPEIKAAIVTGEPSAEWGQIVVADIVSQLTDKEIKEFLAGKISKYKIPKKIYRIDKVSDEK